MRNTLLKDVPLKLCKAMLGICPSGRSGENSSQERRNYLRNVSITNNKKITEFHGNFHQVTNENNWALPTEMTNSSAVPRIFVHAKNKRGSLQLHEKLQADDE